MAKPLANGLPIGAIIMRDSVADVIKNGAFFSAYQIRPWLTIDFASR